MKRPHRFEIVIEPHLRRQRDTQSSTVNYRFNTALQNIDLLHQR